MHTLSVAAVNGKEANKALWFLTFPVQATYSSCRAVQTFIKTSCTPTCSRSTPFLQHPAKSDQQIIRTVEVPAQLQHLAGDLKRAQVNLHGSLYHFGKTSHLVHGRQKSIQHGWLLGLSCCCQLVELLVQCLVEGQCITTAAAQLLQVLADARHQSHQLYRAVESAPAISAKQRGKLRTRNSADVWMLQERRKSPVQAVRGPCPVRLVIPEGSKRGVLGPCHQVRIPRRYILHSYSTVGVIPDSVQPRLNARCKGKLLPVTEHKSLQVAVCLNKGWRC